MEIKQKMDLVFFMWCVLIFASHSKFIELRQKDLIKVYFIKFQECFEVDLHYLRGLEIAELKEENMPMV
tara:strand:- start:387 stop:593 length:207 start_codon:yes stop_codon:yes gene_type:complete